MIEIPFRFNGPLVILENSRVFGKMKISDEWSIVIRLKIIGFSLAFNSVEIHRNNTEGEVSVSGELKISENFRLITQKIFSESIKNGSSFTEIFLNTNAEYSTNILFEGVLKILDISEKRSINFPKEESKLKMLMKSLEELSSDLEKLLHPESSYSTDVILRCDGVSIPAHKSILSARSPVFAAMFAHPMKESLKNEVDITDTDESVLRSLLKFMYTGKTSDLTVPSAADLLSAAEKYQLQDLKAVCSFFLKAAVSPESVWQILVLGDMYSSADLKTFAVDYICKQCGKFSDVRNTQEWKELRKEKPELAVDLLESLVKHREERSNSKN